MRKLDSVQCGQCAVRKLDSVQCGLARVELDGEKCNDSNVDTGQCAMWTLDSVQCGYWTVCSADYVQC